MKKSTQEIIYAKDESHAEILETYIKQTEKWITGENSATRIKR